jgi:hypothetical protein
MKLLDILKEVLDEEIRKKEKLNKRGMFKSVYDFETRPGYVLKTWNAAKFEDNMVKKEYAIFKNNPDLFASIIKINWDKRWMAQEKLDSDKAYNELEDLSDYFDMTASELTDHLEINALNKKVLDIDLKMLSQVDSSKVPIYKKWADFFEKIKGIRFLGSKDLNPGNFGYDKSGNLKLLDI